jgi:RNA polymerase sigma-B factor
MPVRTTALDPDRPTSRAERSEETARLLEAAHAATDPGERAALLDRVVLLNRGVAEAVAHRYRHRGVRDDDLQQAAYEGLVKAVQRFDPTVRPDLLTYAVPTIRGEVQRWFRDQSWMVRPPRRIQELQWRTRRSADELSQRLGRPPTDAEVADDAGCSVAEYDEAQAAYGCFAPTSLDRPLRDDDGGATLGDLLPGADPGAAEAAADARATLAPLVRQLSQRDRRIIHLRYVEQRSQREIGDSLGVTQMQVSRLLDRILRDLRAAA